MRIEIRDRDKFATGLEITKRDFLDVKPINHRYFTDFENDVLLTMTIFNDEQTEHVFRHTDCPLVFITRGDAIFALDMDEIDVDPFTKYGFEQIEAVYNSYQEFLDTIIKLEKTLGYKLSLSTWDGTKETYITYDIKIIEAKG